MPEPQAARELVAASIRLRAALEAAEAIYSESSDEVDGGLAVAEMVRTYGDQLRDCRLTDHLEEFTDARSRLREVILLACLDEGMTITEYAKLYGVSRQQVQRLARKARADD